MTPANAKRLRSLILLAFVILVIATWVFLQGYGCGYKTFRAPGQPVIFDYPAHYALDPQSGQADPDVPEVKGAWTASGGGAITGFTVVWTHPRWNSSAPSARQQWIEAYVSDMVARIAGKILARSDVQRTAGPGQRVEFQGTLSGKDYYFVVEFFQRGDDLYTLIIEGSDPAIRTDERGTHFFQSFCTVQENAPGGK